MNLEFDFDRLSPAEREARCRQIAAQKDTLEIELRGQEQALQQTRTAAAQLRRQAQTLLEQLVAALLPNLSAPIKSGLARIFPHNPELFRDLPAAQAQKGCLLSISTFFSNLFGASANPLEDRRVMLRNILWQLNQIPPNAGELTELFRAFLEAKNNYFAHDRMMNQQEAQANQAVEKVNELAKQLRRCRDWLNPRQDEDETIYDSPVYGQTIYNQPSSDANIFESTPLADSSRFDSTSDTAKASFEASSDSAGQNVDAAPDTSFGGGGDFAGGGAGGSWENYS